MSRLFPVNEHGIERVARVAAGIGLVGAAVTGTLGPWAYIGVVPLLTGLLGSCPLYPRLGSSTCPMSRRPAAR